MLMIKNAKGIEIDTIFCYYTYQCIEFKCAFNLLNYKIQQCVFHKSSFLCVGMHG
jgi:hypothetical protein